MRFLLAPTSVTLNDLERHYSPNLCTISANSVAFWARYVKVVEDKCFLQWKCRQKNLVVSDISYMAIFAGNHPSDSVNMRHSPLASENLTITWKRCKIGGKLVLITNRKSYMSFRLVPKSVTLNDLERRNGPYFELFHRIW